MYPIVFIEIGTSLHTGGSAQIRHEETILKSLYNRGSDVKREKRDGEREESVYNRVSTRMLERSKFTKKREGDYTLHIT
jgi:hypothetical protein